MANTSLIGGRAVRKVLPMVLVISLLVSVLPATAEAPDLRLNDPPDESPSPGLKLVAGDLTGRFTENLGQWGSDVGFVAQCTFGHAVFTRDGVVYDVARAEGGTRVKLVFDGGASVVPEGTGDLGFPTNYLIGNDEDDWVRGANSYRELVYQDVWPGVDVRYRFSGGNLKYDLVLDGDADPSIARFKVAGAEGLRADGDRLDILLPDGGSLSDADLVAWHGDGEHVNARFDIKGDTFGFQVSREEGRPLVIDPVVLHSSTFLGGTYWEMSRDVVVDSNGDVIMVGMTDSTDFPVTPGSYDQVMNTTDVVVVKMNHNCSQIEWATYLGGGNYENVQTVTVDERDDVFLAGYTWSGDFPISKGAYCEGINLNTGPYNVDVYITKMSGEGDSVEHSTFLGGTTAEEPYDIKVRNGVLAIGGYTNSGDFPTTMGPHSSNFGAAFVMTFDDELTTMESSWIWDGIASETVQAVDFDDDGNVILAGWSGSPGFPTTSGAYQREKSGWLDTFIARFSPEENFPLECTLLGGSGTTYTRSMAVDKDKNVYVAGFTRGTDGFGHPVTEGAFDVHYDSNPMSSMEGFITKMDPNGTRLIYSTLMGGDGRDDISAISVDSKGNVVGVATVKAGGNLTVTEDGHDDTFSGESEGYVFQLNDDGTDLIYGSFHGGTYVDELSSVCLDVVDNWVVVGHTESHDLPVTSDGFQTRYGGYGDMVVSVIGEHAPTSAPLSLVAEGKEGCIDLHWMPPEYEGDYPVREYHIFRGESEDDLRLYSIEDETLRFRDDDVEWGRTYYYAVYASNWKGMSPRSNVASAMSVTVPDPPVNMTALVNVDSVMLGWEAPSFTGGLPVSGYRVYRTAEDGDRELLTTVGPVLRTYVDTAPEAGTNYTYSITALNEHGESRGEASVTVLTAAVPTPPRALDHTYGSLFIHLTWEAPMMDFGFPLTEYRVYRWSGDDTPEMLTILDAAETSYNDTDVMLGRGYSYHVTASNLKGESLPSVPLDAKVMVPPGPPTSVVAVATEQFVRLTWTPPVFDGASPVTAYRVYIVADDGGTTCIGSQNVADVADVQLAFLHDVPYDGTVRTYFVRAVNGEGESMPSDEASTQVYQVPSAPQGPSIAWGDGSLSIAWEAPGSDGGTPVLSFQLYRRAEGDAYLSHLEDLPWGTFGFEDVTVENGVEYTYAISCVNLIGEGPMSGTVSAIPAGLPDPPSEVTAQGSDGSVLVSWGPPAWDGGRPVTGYRIFVISDGPTPQMLAELDADETEFLDEDLVNGRVYMYAVTALTTVGTSQLSGMVEAIPVGPPTQPTGLEAFWMGDHVLLTWDAPEDDGGSPVVGYMLHREDQDPDNMTLLTDLTFMDFDVEPDTEYNYTIYAFGSAGEGPVARVTFTVPKEEEPPVEPEAVEWTYMVLLVVLLALAIALLYMGLRGRTAS